eukprot:snap_masked-scaffold_12-processed-gene-3.41-mRNA-1 protein AED:1.00 eAED:1.00 QI:0/0/0/0/1/1/2/0/95
MERNFDFFAIHFLERKVKSVINIHSNGFTNITWIANCFSCLALLIIRVQSAMATQKIDKDTGPTHEYTLLYSNITDESIVFQPAIKFLNQVKVSS